MSKGTVAQGHVSFTYFPALNLCYTIQINEVSSQTIGIALLPDEGSCPFWFLCHCSCAVLASKRSVLCKMGTDLGALYHTFTKINSIFSILFKMRRPRTLYKCTFFVEVNCTLITGMVFGKSKRGRPKTRYKDNIKESTNLSMVHVCRMAQDRRGWKHFIMDAMANHFNDLSI